MADNNSTVVTERGDEKNVSHSPHTSMSKELEPESENSITENEENSTDDHEGELGPMGLLCIVVALMLCVFLVSLDQTIVATAIPKITDEFHGLDLTGWYASGFFLTIGAFQSTFGKIYKYFPLKPGFLLAIFIFEIGSLVCGVAPNSTTLILGRAIAGMGAAGLGSGAYTIIAFCAPVAQRATYTGLLGVSYGFASVIGPLLGGVFAQKVTWRWCFYINLPIGGLAAAIILFTFKTPARAAPAKATMKEKFLQMDLVGTFIVMAAIVCYILAFQWGGQKYAWKSSVVIGTLIGGVLIIIAFIVLAAFQGDRSIIPPRLFKQRFIWANMTFMFFFSGAWFTTLYYLPIYFQVVSGVTASESGVRNLPLIISIVLSTIACGGTISATGHFVSWLVGAGTLATIGTGLLYTLDAHSSSSKWIGYQVVAGLGFGAGVQIPIIVGQALALPGDITATTALMLFAQTIGGALSVGAAEAAFANTLAKKLPITAPNVDAASVIAAGIAEIRSTFPDAVEGIVAAYVDSLHVVFALCIALAGISFFCCFLPKWVNLKGKIAPGGAV